MILAIVLLLSPICIAFGGNRSLEIFVEGRARRSGIRRDVRKEVWRDRSLFVAHILMVVGTDIGLLGLIFRTSLGNAQYALYAIGIAIVLWAFILELKAYLALLERFTR